MEEKNRQNEISSGIVVKDGVVSTGPAELSFGVMVKNGVVTGVGRSKTYVPLPNSKPEIVPVS